MFIPTIFFFLPFEPSLNVKRALKEGHQTWMTLNFTHPAISFFHISRSLLACIKWAKTCKSTDLDEEFIFFYYFAKI